MCSTSHLSKAFHFPWCFLFPKEYIYLYLYFVIAAEPILRALRKGRVFSGVRWLIWVWSTLNYQSTHENSWKHLPGSHYVEGREEKEGMQSVFILVTPLGYAWWRSGRQTSWINRVLLTGEKCKCTLQSVCANIKWVCNPGLWNGASYSVREKLLWACPTILEQSTLPLKVPVSAWQRYKTTCRTIKE